MPLLYYWRPDNHRRDLDMGAGYNLNQANPLLHEVEPGDSLWAFTRNRQNRFVLAAELVIRAKTLNPPAFRYGRYRVWGDLKRSRYFETDEQPSVEQIVRSLSCKADAAILSQSFQGRAAVRRITLNDHALLLAAAQSLPREPRARLLPEERLEASLLLGDDEAIRSLIHEEDPGMADKRREYLFSKAITRNRELVQELQQLYEGRCQICQWNPRDVYGCFLCHGHHIQWLSRGGDDVRENLLLVCPNHHGAIHRCDAPLDFNDLTFDFGKVSEPVTLNQHLPW